MKILFGMVIIIASILNIAIPEQMWELYEGWKFRNAEPSDTALTMARIGGVFGIIAGLIIMFIG